MTSYRATLLTSAALALALPSLAAAQEAMVEEPGAATTGTEMPATEMPATEMTGTEMGVTDVTPTSANEPMDLSTWTYDDLYANGISIDRIMDSDVYGPNGDDVGDVDNVLFNMDGQILSIVARMDDGFLGLGRTHVNIPWDMVSTETWTEGLAIPFTEDEVDSYAMPVEGGEIAGAEEVAEVSGGVFQDVETGPNVWRATDLLNNAAQLQEGEAYESYGIINDIVVRDGQIAAVLVTPDAGWGAPDGSVYGYPYAGTVGWTPGTAEGTVTDGTMATDGTMPAQDGTGMTTGTYNLPYDRSQAEMVQPFDPAMLTD